MALATLASTISQDIISNDNLQPWGSNGFTSFSDVLSEVCLKLRRYLVMSIDCAQSQDSVSTAEKWHCPAPLVPFLFIELSWAAFSWTLTDGG